MKKVLEGIRSLIDYLMYHRLCVMDTKSITSQVVGRKTIAIFIVFIVALCSLVGLISYRCGYRTAERDIFEKGVQSYYEKPVSIIIDGVPVEEFSEENLVNMLVSLNVKYPDVVLAQAQIETGNYTSHIFLDNNNLFGMKAARSRIHTHEGTQHGHAYYTNWQQSVMDYAMYQATYLSKIETKDQYIDYLNRSYAEVGDRYGKMIRAKISDINKKYEF